MRLVVFVCFLTISPGFRETLLAADNRVLIADGKISLIIPDGWAKTELNAADVLAGYATQDNRNSVFFRAMDTSSTGGMQELLDATVAAILGPCIGGGLEIACACDLRIAGEGAKFGAPIM